MKKFFAAVLVCALCFMLAGCGRFGIFGNEVDRWLSESDSEPEHGYADDNDGHDDYGGYGESGESGSESGETYTGAVGDTMSTCFFDFTVESVQQADYYEGKTPDSGMTYLDAVITVKNTYGEELPMSVYDFQIQWGDFNDDQYDYEAEAFWDGETTMPEHYKLAADDSITTHVVYQVPADSVEGYYVICYLEEFSDGSEGDLFGIVFPLDETASGTMSGMATAA
jgi:hypothetical protein